MCMKKHTREVLCFHAWIGHGKRRRRCRLCGFSKVIRKRKRGRKAKRPNIFMLKKFLYGQPYPRSSKALCVARDSFVRGKIEVPVFAPGPLVLIADALHLKTKTYKIFVHIFLVLSPQEDRAWILEPYFDCGGENEDSWRKAVITIPPPIQDRVKALICDGKAGLIRVGKTSGWLIQRCQFHLIARLQLKRSKYALSRHRKEGLRLYELAKSVFSERDDEKLKKVLSILSAIAEVETNRYLKTILKGFARHYEGYRTYLYHPDLKLPQTTNPVESVNSLIRNLMRRMRGFENENSARQWIRALIKNRRFIRIKNQQN